MCPQGASAVPPTCSLDDPRVRSVLERLYAESRGQLLGIAGEFFEYATDWILGRKVTSEIEGARLRNLYVPLTAKQGRLVYQIARSIGARRIVEFGSSVGISTIHFAAAMRDNGGGIVVGTDIEPTKVARARANIEQAGLSAYVEIREGDAERTLVDPGGPVDMVLLDGFKSLYLPILNLLTPHLHTGSVVFADNIFLFPQALRPYVAYVQDARNGFSSVTLALGSGAEYSVRI